jgi:hypothetical protein
MTSDHAVNPFDDDRRTRDSAPNRKWRNGCEATAEVESSRRVKPTGDRLTRDNVTFRNA